MTASTILARAHRDAQRVAASLPADDLIIRGVWKNQYWLRLTNESSVLALQYLVLQTTHQGCCYFDGPDLPGAHALLGRSALSIRGPRTVRVAALDAVLLAARNGSGSEVVWTGNPISKASDRASTVVDEVVRLVSQREIVAPRICVVGVVGEMLALLVAQRSWTVHATDFAPDLVGKRIHGVNIRHGSHTLEEVERANVALVTGMTIGNGSFDPILETARRSRTELVMFCETAAGFGPTLVESGVAVVVSEEHPFYLCTPGPSVARIYRRA